MGRFVGTFLQGQPAKTAMSGGTQWIEWKVEDLESMVVACKKESSMAGADVLPAYTHEPGTIQQFLEHLDKCGKTQYKIVCHKVERDDIGRVIKVVPQETTCLPLPTTTPSKKKYTLENIAGYVDIEAIKKSKYLQIVHNLVCPMASRARQNTHPNLLVCPMASRAKQKHTHTQSRVSHDTTSQTEHTHTYTYTSTEHRTLIMHTYTWTQSHVSHGVMNQHIHTYTSTECRT